MRFFQNEPCNCGDDGLDAVHALLTVVFDGEPAEPLIPSRADDAFEPFIRSLVRLAASMLYVTVQESEVAEDFEIADFQPENPLPAFMFGVLDGAWPYAASRFDGQLPPKMPEAVIGVFEAHASDDLIAELYAGLPLP